MTSVRFWTALVVAPPVLAGMFLLSGTLFAAMVGGFILLGAWEWSKLAGLVHRRWRTIFVGGICVALVGAWFAPEELLTLFLVVGVGWWGVALGLVMGYPATMTNWSGPWRKLFTGWLVLVPAWVAMVVLKGTDRADGYLLMLLLLIWAADVGAYFAGRRFGKTKLAPAVSPGKSWEGVLGGMVFAAGVAVVLGWFFETRGIVDWLALLTVSGATVAASVLGDLFESALKRGAGFKDSGSLLPGHGGVLDRIDSLTAAAPLFALCVASGAI